MPHVSFFGSRAPASLVATSEAWLLAVRIEGENPFAFSMLVEREKPLASAEEAAAFAAWLLMPGWDRAARPLEAPIEKESRLYHGFELHADEGSLRCVFPADADATVDWDAVCRHIDAFRTTVSGEEASHG